MAYLDSCSLVFFKALGTKIKFFNSEEGQVSHPPQTSQKRPHVGIFDSKMFVKIHIFRKCMVCWGSF